MKTSPLSYPENFPIGRKFGITAKLYYGALVKKLEKLDIERHYSILILLSQKNVFYTQQNISDILKVDKAQMVRMISYLLRKKYIRKLVNPEDRREYHLQLTAKAHIVLPQINDAISQLNNHLQKGFTKKQLNIFYAMLEQMQQNLEKEPKHSIIVQFKKAK